MIGFVESMPLLSNNALSLSGGRNVFVFASRTAPIGTLIEFGIWPDGSPDKLNSQHTL